MKTKRAITYLTKLENDAIYEDEIYEPMIVRGYISHFLEILKILEEDNPEL